MSAVETSERRQAWCKCGAAFDARGRGDAAHDLLREFADEWWACHTGEGHGPTNATVARNARRREKYAEDKARREEYGW